MTARTVRAFLPTLREVGRALSTPIPNRVRILRELEFDLEELYGELLSRGVPKDEARRRAIEALVPDRTVLHQLAHLHMPIYPRVTGGMSEARVRLMERSALVLATAFSLSVGAAALLRGDLLANPSPFLVPVLGLGALLVARILVKAFQLWVRGDHQEPARGLKTILGLSTATLAMAVTGTLVDSYRLAGRLEVAPQLAGELIPQWLVQAAALVSAAMVFALLGGLTWFVITQWMTLTATAYQEALGLTTHTFGSTQTPHPEDL